MSHSLGAAVSSSLQSLWALLFTELKLVYHRKVRAKRQPDEGSGTGPGVADERSSFNQSSSSGSGSVTESPSPGDGVLTVDGPSLFRARVPGGLSAGCAESLSSTSSDSYSENCEHTYKHTL